MIFFLSMHTKFRPHCCSCYDISCLIVEWSFQIFLSIKSLPFIYICETTQITKPAVVVCWNLLDNPPPFSLVKYFIPVDKLGSTGAVVYHGSVNSSWAPDNVVPIPPPSGWPPGISIFRKWTGKCPTTGAKKVVQMPRGRGSKMFYFLRFST